MLTDIYRDQWDADALCSSAVLAETRAIFGRAIDKGVPRSTSHRTAFRQRLKASTDVFSAFRVHRQAQDVAAQLVDENGNRRSFRDWAERVQPYLNHQNRAWLQTEYSTAIRRAHDEADWQRFADDADLYPNLEWVPSTSAHPGADHKGYWGTVLPVDDAFWSEHRPGDRWNCKCSLRQTDKAPTAAPRVSGAKYAPQPGLRAKPGSGEIFSNDHPYFPKSCGACPYGGGKLAALWHSLVGGKKDCYECRRVRTVVERSDEAGGGVEKETPRKLFERLTSAKGNEFGQTLRDIIETVPFKKLEKDIYSAASENDADLPNLMNAARRAVAHGNTVYVLPNPKGIRTADFIFERKKRLKMYDLKTITGKNSVSNRLHESVGQTNRVLLNMTVDYKPRQLAKDITRYFETNPEAAEVLVYKGGKAISVTKEWTERKDFVLHFMREFVK